MPALRLTTQNINRIKPPEKGEVIYWDTKTKGFGLRVKPASMTYIAQARIKNNPRQRGRLVKVTLGRHGILTPEQAESEAKKALYRLLMGDNPNAKNLTDEARELRLGELFDKYVEAKKLRPKTLVTYRSAMRRCFGDWLDKRVIDITKDMVQKRHQVISNKNGPRGKGEAQANQAMRILRSLFNYAAIIYEDADGRSTLQDNPVKRLTHLRAWNKLHRRQDVILPHELQRWITAVLGLEDNVMRDYLLFCLFTGLRRTEAAMITWNQVHFEARMILIPAANTKANRDHALPLSDFLYALLIQRQRDADHRFDNNRVFPARSGGNLIEPKRTIARLVADTGIKFSMHTLRRTFETIAERLDISHYALKRLINHSTSGDVTSGYIIIDVERLRAPMQRITNFISDVGVLNQKGNVS